VGGCGISDRDRARSPAAKHAQTKVFEETVAVLMLSSLRSEKFATTKALLQL
jgi:hypothetical protein